MRLLVLIMFLVGCGTEFERNTDYRLYCAKCTNYEKILVKSLVKDFNKQAGIEALKWSDDPVKGNSPVRFVNGLIEENVLGQAEYQKTKGFKTQWHKGCKQKVVEDITVDLWFDREYFNDPDISLFSKKKTFYHEIGHGMLFTHTENVRDVMFPFINEDESGIKPFFDRVRRFYQGVTNY